VENSTTPTQPTATYPTSFAFINNSLHALKATSKPGRATPAPDLASLLHTIANNEDDFYMKMFTNGHELTSNSQSASMVLDAKQLADIGLKDGQTINVALFSRVSSGPTRLTPQCVPMLLLSKEGNFKSMFSLLNVLSTLSEKKTALVKDCAIAKVNITITVKFPIEITTLEIKLLTSRDWSEIMVFTPVFRYVITYYMIK